MCIFNPPRRVADTSEGSRSVMKLQLLNCCCAPTETMSSRNARLELANRSAPDPRASCGRGCSTICRPR
jgi:hypothetical protein